MSTIYKLQFEVLPLNKWILHVDCSDYFLTYAGVYTTSIDPEQQQVTVTGSIDSDILLKKLSKLGKHAEICSKIR